MFYITGVNLDRNLSSTFLILLYLLYHSKGRTKGPVTGQDWLLPFLWTQRRGDVTGRPARTTEIGLRTVLEKQGNVGGGRSGNSVVIRCERDAG